MKPLILLHEADKLRLDSLLNHHLPPPFPSPVAHATLEDILSSAKIVRDAALMDHHVSLFDEVTLVSPTDSRDYFKLAIVLPHQADVDADLISISTPISLAVFGRKSGDLVRWETPHGSREMRIVALKKHEELPALATA